MRQLVFLLAMAFAAFSATAEEMQPLIKGIAQGDEAAVKRLANADTVNQAIAKNNKSITPLSIAVFITISDKNDQASMLHIIDTLLDRGADPNVVLRNGATPASIVDLMAFLENSAAKDKTHTAAELKSIKLIKAIHAKLRKHGGMANSKRVAALEQELDRRK